MFASAIRALGSDGSIGDSVTVSRSRTGVRGYAWSVTFDDLGVGDHPQLVAVANASLETRTTGGSFSLEVDTVTDGVAAIGGSFEASFINAGAVGDETEEFTGPLAAHNVSAREVEAAIEALTGVGDVTVDVELLNGGEGGRVFTVTWPSGRGNVPALRVNGSGLTPTLDDVGGVPSEAAAAYVNEVSVIGLFQYERRMGLVMYLLTMRRLGGYEHTLARVTAVGASPLHVAVVVLFNNVLAPKQQEGVDTVSRTKLDYVLGLKTSGL